MKNRLLHNMYMVILVALGLVSQEVSAMGRYLGPQTNYRNLQQGRGLSGPIYPKTYFSSMGAPSAPMSAPVVPSVGYDPAYNPSYGLNLSSFRPTAKTFETYAPTKETFYPSNIWGKIKSGYGQLPSREEAMQSARALPGQALSLGQTGFAAIGRPVIAAPSAIGSTGSWLGSKLWSYAPQTAQEYASGASKFISENAYAPTAKAFSKYVWNPVSTNIAQPLSETQAAQWFSNMTDEQKQAAVGLAAVIAAGIAAKKGLDYWRGPSAYSQFKQAIDEKLSYMLERYAIDSKDELALSIGDTIRVYYTIINDELKAGALSQSEAYDLINYLDSKTKQLDEIGEINQQITVLNKNYDWDIADTLANIVATSPILTDEQKDILQKKANFIKKAYQQ